MSHTPGLMSYEGGELLVRESVTSVAEVTRRTPWREIPGAVVEANGQRLAAAWNACDGMPTERLQPGLVTGLLTTIHQLRFTLVRLGVVVEFPPADPAVTEHTLQGCREAIAAADAALKPPA
jgi:hypothetical protein